MIQTRSLSLQDDDADNQDTGRLAQEMLAEIHESISVDALNSIVHSLRSSLQLLSSDEADLKQVIAWSALADAQHMFFRASNGLSHLDDTISSIKAAFKHIHTHGAQSVAPELDLEVLEARMQALMLERVTSNPNFSLEDRFKDSLRASGRDSSQPQNARYAMACADVYDRATSFMARFKTDRNRQHLEEAISLHRQALKMRTFRHPFRSESLEALATRFDTGGEPSDLEEAVPLFREALTVGSSLSSSERAELMYNTANALAMRYRQGGATDDLDDGVSLFRQSLELRPATHPARHWSLFGLANVLLMQSKLTGQSKLLNEAVKSQREAVDLCPSPNPDRLTARWSRERTLGPLAVQRSAMRPG